MDKLKNVNSFTDCQYSKKKQEQNWWMQRKAASTKNSFENMS